jgi:hypothetical protein
MTSVNDADTAYYSGWDIDQLISTNTVTVSGSGATTLVDFSSLNVPAIPVFSVQFKPSGSSKWFNEGGNSTDGTGANYFIFYSYVTGTTLVIDTGSAGTARYFIWTDKVNY